MKENWVNPEGMDVATDRFDRLIEWLLIALLVFCASCLWGGACLERGGYHRPGGG